MRKMYAVRNVHPDCSELTSTANQPPGSQTEARWRFFWHLSEGERLNAGKVVGGEMSVGPWGWRAALFPFLYFPCLWVSLCHSGRRSRGRRRREHSWVRGHGAQVRRLPLARAPLLLLRPLGRPAAKQQPASLPARNPLCIGKSFEARRSLLRFGFSVCALHTTRCCAYVRARAPTLWAAMCHTPADVSGTLLSGARPRPQTTLLCSPVFLRKQRLHRREAV